MNTARTVRLATGAGRPIHTASRLLSPSPLFALPQLSASRESQFLSKGKGIPRSEFSPALQLIRSGEIDNLPYEKPAQSASRGMTTLSVAAQPNFAALPIKLEDAQVVNMGRVLLNEHQRIVAGLREDLDLIRQSFLDVTARAESAQSKAFIIGAAAVLFSYWIYYESQSPPVAADQAPLKERIRHSFAKGRPSSFNDDMRHHWKMPGETLAVPVEGVSEDVAQAATLATGTSAYAASEGFAEGA